MYEDGLVYPEFLQEMERRLDRFTVDGVQDIGVIQQLSEKYWYSPFPQFQSTRRPDRAAMALLEGRMVVLVDNSPEALIFPTDYNSFIRRQMITITGGRLLLLPGSCGMRRPSWRWFSRGCIWR